MRRPRPTIQIDGGIRVLDLPWPPSANRYWRHPGKGLHLISEAGRAYRRAVSQAVMLQPGPRFPDARLRLVINVHAPDRRRRDLDNLLKATQDALEHAGVYGNDSQIDELHVQRAERCPGGVMVVKIFRIDGAQ